MNSNYDDLLADFLGNEVQNPSTKPPVAHDIFVVAQKIASDKGSERTEGLAMLREVLSGEVKLDQKNSSSLRPADIIARGVSSPEAGMAIELMAESGYVEPMFKAPTASEMPPLMSAAYHGNAFVVDSFLQLGMPVDVTANAVKAKILGGTAYHACVAGYRASSKEDYMSIMSSLLEAAPEVVNQPDRMKQKPIDLAMKMSVATGDKTMVVAIMQHGVDLDQTSASGAGKLMDAMIKNDKGSQEQMRALKSVNEAKRVINEMTEMTRSFPSP